MWINGQIVDRRGRPVPGVRIEAAGSARAELRCVATSNAAGHFVMCDLRPGTYTITFARPGFLTQRRTSDLAGYVATINAELEAIGS